MPEIIENQGEAPDVCGLAAGVRWEITPEYVHCDLRQSQVTHVEDLLWLQASKAGFTYGDRKITFLIRNPKRFLRDIQDTVVLQRSEDPAMQEQLERHGFWPRYRDMTFKTVSEDGTLVTVQGGEE